MRTSASPVLPVFRSKLQGDLLARVLLNPDGEHSLTELAERVRGSVAAVQREVERLEKAGIVRSRRVGRSRLVTAETSSPLCEPLSRLVLLTFGPGHVVAEELAGVDGIDDVYLFGSWAARYEGIAGQAPVDLDVLVIGDPDRDAVHSAALRAEERLGREVNVTIRSKGSWDRGQDGFVRQVKSSPLVPIALVTEEE